MRALSIRQPWAWLILHGGKNIENRSWKTKVRGLFYLHAAKEMTREDYDNAVAFAAIANPAIKVPAFDELPRGVLVGRARLVDCVRVLDAPPSIWFTGPYGFILRDAEPIRLVPCQGKLGFFEPVIDDRLVCSPDSPMPAGARGRWLHLRTEECGEQERGWPSGDLVRVRCKDCGATWKEELPQ